MTIAKRSMMVSWLPRADKSRGIRGTVAGLRYINLSRGKRFFHLGKNASPFSSFFVHPGTTIDPLNARRACFLKNARNGDHGDPIMRRKLRSSIEKHANRDISNITRM